MKRYTLLDGIRGMTLVSMILFHVVWDIVYIFGADWKWYQTGAAYLWQQSICWIFIFLSGFCFSLGKRKWRRGVEVFLAGVLISAVTLIFMPEERVICGVLTLIGTAMLLLNLLSPLLQKINAGRGLGGSLLLFVLTRNINRGYLGFEDLNLVKLPEELYRNMFTTFLGFPAADFYSADYFSLLPWIFLYIAGFFLYQIMEQREWMSIFEKRWLQPLEWFGKNSLILYLLHQPVIYGVLFFYFNFMKKG